MPYSHVSAARVKRGSPCLTVILKRKKWEKCIKMREKGEEKRKNKCKTENLFDKFSFSRLIEERGKPLFLCLLSLASIFPLTTPNATIFFEKM